MAKENQMSQSWENCKYRVGMPIGCKNKKLVELIEREDVLEGKSYTIEEVQKKKDTAKIISFYDMSIFDINSRSTLIKILGELQTFFKMQYDLNFNYPSEINDLSHSKLIKRATAGCLHCKFYESK